MNTSQPRRARRAAYVYSCPDCDRAVVVHARYRALQRRPCLVCIRLANGWEHQPGCALPNDHYGLCDGAR